MTASKEQLFNPLDAMWRVMESRDTPMHLGVLAIFNLPKSASPRYMSELAGKFREFTAPKPPWNYRWPIRNRLPAGAPSEVDEFDIDYHFRHSSLPNPGGERQLGMLISRLHSQPLSGDYPLWEFHLIEGLENQRFAAYLKVHRAVARNINAVPLLMSCLAASPRKRKFEPFWVADTGVGDPSTIDQMTRIPREVLRSAAGVSGDMLRSLMRPTDLASYLLPGKTPRSTLNRRINHVRRFATQQFKFERIKALAERCDATVEDVVTFICSSALRRFFKEYNALPDESLIAGVPVQLQQAGEATASNAIAGLRLTLHTNVGNPLERLDAVKRTVAALTEELASLPQHAVGAYTFFRSMPIYGSQLPGIGRVIPPLFNVAITGLVSSPQQPMYLNGSRLDAVYSLNALMQYSALSIDVVNYNDSLNIGLTGARDTLPALQRMAVYMGQALEELERLVDEAGAGEDDE